MNFNLNVTPDLKQMLESIGRGFASEMQRVMIACLEKGYEKGQEVEREKFLELLRNRNNEPDAAIQRKANALFSEAYAHLGFGTNVRKNLRLAFDALVSWGRGSEIPIGTGTKLFNHMTKHGKWDHSLDTEDESGKPCTAAIYRDMKDRPRTTLFRKTRRGFCTLKDEVWDAIFGK